MAEKQITISLDKSLKAYNAIKRNNTQENLQKVKGVVEIRPINIEYRGYSQQGITAEKIANINNNINKRYFLVDRQKGIERGYYYKIEDVLNLIIELTQKCNTILEYNQIIVDYNSLFKLLTPNIEANEILNTEEGHFVKQEILDKILNSLKGSPEIILGTDGYIANFKSEMIDNGDLKINLNVVLKNKKEKTPVTQHNFEQNEVVSNQNIPNYINTTPNISPAITPVKKETNIYPSPKKIQQAPLSPQEINELEKLAKAIRKYVIEPTEKTQKIFHNVKENTKRKIKQNPEKTKNAIQKLIIYAATALLVVNIGHKISTITSPQPTPQPTPSITPTTITTPSPTPTDFSINIEEITPEELKDNIVLGNYYNISPNTPISTSFETEPVGELEEGEYVCDRIVIYDRNNPEKTICVNALEISNNFGSISSKYEGKTIQEIAAQHGFTDYDISLHLSEKNHPCEAEYAKGWVTNENIEKALENFKYDLQHSQTGGRNL